MVTVMNNITVRIKIWGIVQGVGFRPFVAKLADQMNMKGEVRNVGGLVVIVVTDKEDIIQEFVQQIRLQKPLPSEIVHIKTEQINTIKYEGFLISNSNEEINSVAMIPADLALCQDCLQELFEEGNPRFSHPFISCMVCGPRYSIIHKLPYDRDTTAMDEFPMCSFCHEEYTDIENRRYHAQTISCHDCGPIIKYQLNPNSFEEVAMSFGIIGSNAPEKVQNQVQVPIGIATSLLNEGRIIALKGVGGYHLLCDLFQDEAVSKLRFVKGREEKPFAIMFKDVDQVREYCLVSETEERLLISSARPIVLLERKKDLSPEDVLNFSKETCRGSRFIGAFLPSVGIQHLLMEQISPLIATSANISELPIITDDNMMFKFMENEVGIAAVFYNDRKILVGLDDSVVRVIDDQPQMIRRSKGYAPTPIHISFQEVDSDPSKLEEDLQVLATGGHLKSAFSLSKGSFAYLSQHIGDLDRNEFIDIYHQNYERMCSLFSIHPKLIVCDMHPLYATTDVAENLSDQLKVKYLRVQHHHAHVASVMAEHSLQDWVIGVVFDGTGYGDDGNIWGGEFLLCKGKDYRRMAHLEYVKMLGGDSSMKEGWKSAMCYYHHYNNQKEDAFTKIDSSGKAQSIKVDLSDIMEFTRIQEDPNWTLVNAALTHGVNIIKSSSMGRLFDAVASLLGIHHVNRYEGECASMLENAAAEGMESEDAPLEKKLALSFHIRIAEMILNQCQQIKSEISGEFPLNQVALSGGVFQNKILMEKTLELLRQSGFEVYYNVSVGPNDGGIALGQNYIGIHTLREG